MTVGFQLQPRRYRLIFEAPELEGFEVTARGLTVDEAMGLSGLDERTVLGGLVLPDDVPLPQTALERLAERLVEWNLTDAKGKPVPPSVQALRGMEIPVARALLNAWLRATTGVSDPLERRSGSGPGSAAPSAAELADLSVSLPS